MEEQDRKKVEEYRDARDSPANKLLSKLKWFHYVIFACVILLFIWWSYKDVTSSKFSVDEKSLIFNSLTYFNATNVTPIMTKVNLSGHFNPTPILALTLMFILVIAYLLAKKSEKLLDWHLALRIVRHALESEVGIGGVFPYGTKFQVGPAAKEMDIGTLGLSEFAKNKWGILVKAILPGPLTERYIAFVDSKDGRLKGIIEQGKVDITTDWKDVKVIKPFDLWAMEESRKRGLKSNVQNPYFFMGS